MWVFTRSGREKAVGGVLGVAILDTVNFVQRQKRVTLLKEKYFRQIAWSGDTDNAYYTTHATS